MPDQSQRPIYQSGDWEIDLARRELRTRGAPVPLGGRAFELVEVLVRAAGELVSKSDLMARVWPGVTVEENTLQVHISAVRRALGADRGILETASGRGYRLLGTWNVRQQGAPAQPIDAGAEAVAPFRTNLPLPATELVGRTAAIERLQHLASAYRVVTLIGPGGIGKTALVLEVARNAAPTLQGDCWFVELASLSDPRFVPSAVAGILGLGLGGDDISAESVGRAIGATRLLLVLDTCEHVVDATAALVETLVRLCSRTFILATSREILRVAGEYVYRVLPLDVPRQPEKDSSSLLASSAVQLFISRMKALDSEFSPGPNDLAVIAAICRRLDGIPLAIEFAAARAATLGLEPVLARLDERFALLTSGRRSALRRQQTLRATLDWSYELLPQFERQLLRHLAVFVSGFTIDAAMVIMGDEFGGAIVADSLANLVAKSLVVLEGSTPVTRWRLLDTIRAYALEKLIESGEAEHAARRHAEFFSDLVRSAAPGSQSSLTNEQIDRYMVEIDNVRAALDWCFGPRGDSAIGIALTAAYVPMWLYGSLFAECRDRVERALANIESVANDRLSMELNIAFAAALLQSTGVGKGILPASTKALELADELDDAKVQLLALWVQWSYQYNIGEHRVARSLAERFSAIARRIGDPTDVPIADRLVGISLHYQGDQTKAQEFLQRALNRYVAPAARRPVAWYRHDEGVVTRAMLARVLCLRGFVHQAKHAARSSLDEAQASDRKLSVRYALGWAVCPVALMAGDLQTAERAAEMFVDLAVRQDLALWLAIGRGLQGILLIRRGEFAAGTASLHAALDDSIPAGWTLRSPEFLGALAEGLAGTGRVTEAHVVIDQALARSDQTGELWYIAELRRIKGELLLQTAESDSTEAAERCFLDAIAVAHGQSALLWELRAAMSLARLEMTRGRNDEARQALAPVYGRVTEDFEAPDRSSARALLDSLPR